MIGENPALQFFFKAIVFKLLAIFKNPDFPIQFDAPFSMLHWRSPFSISLGLSSFLDVTCQPIDLYGH